MKQTLNKGKFDAIVCLSQIDWNFLWQRTQEVMSQFASMGYPVLFIENTGVRSPGLNDLPRVLKRFKNAFGFRAKKVNCCDKSNLKVVSPLALPYPYSPLAVNFNSYILKRAILNFSKERGIPVERILFWTYMTTPLAVDLASRINWAGMIIDLVSDPCKVEGAELLEKYHRKALELADVVLCASNSVRENAKGYVDKKTYHKLKVFEDGFTVKLSKDFRNDDSVKKQQDIAAYIGGVNDKIWWEAVLNLANNFPDIDFVFVGPKQFEKIPQNNNENIIWCPPFEEYDQLGEFLEQSIVGLIPYVQSPYIMEMRPAKINEYMVMGLPIVSTRLPELERLGRESGSGIVYTAETIEEFSEVFKQALEEDSQELRDKRQRIAQNRSWEKVCKELNYELQLLI